MSENNNQNEITEVETTVSETVTEVAKTESAYGIETAQTETQAISESALSAESAKKEHKYKNKTARLLNNFAFAGVLLTIISLGFQCYLSITSYVQQMAPMGIAVLYTVVSILTPMFAMLAACGLFKFFAEVVELLDRNGKN